MAIPAQNATIQPGGLITILITADFQIVLVATRHLQVITADSVQTAIILRIGIMFLIPTPAIPNVQVVMNRPTGTGQDNVVIATPVHRIGVP